MKTYTSDAVRTIALVGQKGAGKTSLGEAMLFFAKSTTRMGRVEDGNTVFDFEPEEQKRVASVQTSVASLEWKKTKVNVIDTPGLRDFTFEAANGAAVADGIAVVVSAVDGADPYAKRLFTQAAGAARCVVINQAGRERADVSGTLATLKNHFGPACVAVTLPWGQETELRGVVDLLGFQARRHSDSQEAPSAEEVPAELMDEATAARERLFEEIAASDETLMEKYLESGELSVDEARGGLKAALRSGNLVPVFVTDATRGIGVCELLDTVVASFPAPLESRALVGEQDGEPVEVVCRAEGSPLAVAFKTIMDQHAGKITFLKVLQGALSKDTHVTNTQRDVEERLGNLLAPSGKKMDGVTDAHAGDIVAVAKLKDTHTGDTLAGEQSVRVELPAVPETQISYRILPKRKGDEDKLGQSMHKLQEEDPTLNTSHDALTGDMVIGGAGVSHIDVALERLQRKYGVEVERKPPTVPYLETLTKAAQGVEGKHKKQSGGRGQFGVCVLNLRPLPRGEGYRFVDKIFGGAIPRQYIPAVDKGIQEALARGVVAGYPVVDVEVELVDGKFHDVDSSEAAFKIAGSKGFRAAVEKAGITLLEPVMDVTVEIPEECMGDIMGDINSRRGRVVGMESQAGDSVIKAQVPMAEMLTYAPDLKSMTAGRGSFTMKQSHYDPLPSHLRESVVANSPRRPESADEDS